MTANHAALRELSLAEAMDVFDQSAERTNPNRQTQAWAVIRAELKQQQATQLRTAASEGGPSEVVAYQWFRNGKPTGGWFDGVPSERQLQAQKQCTGVAEWTVKYAYSHPPEVARDAGTPAEQSLALQMLVAAGHVTQVKVDEALSIAKSMHPVGAEARDAGLADWRALWAIERTMRLMDCGLSKEAATNAMQQEERAMQQAAISDAALRARAVGDG